MGTKRLNAPEKVRSPVRFELPVYRALNFASALQCRGSEEQPVNKIIYGAIQPNRTIVMTKSTPLTYRVCTSSSLTQTYVLPFPVFPNSQFPGGSPAYSRATLPTNATGCAVILLYPENKASAQSRSVTPRLIDVTI